MKKMRAKTEGWRLQPPPQTEEGRRTAQSAGFLYLPSGQWVFPEPDFRPPLELIRNKPYGRYCRACRSLFRSERPRDRYCGSCRRTMSEVHERLEAILRAKIESEEEQRETWFKVEEELKCPVCGWIQNEGRIVPEDFRLVSGYLPGWIGRAHHHYFRHAYWNRFPYSRRFAPEITPEEHESIYGSNSNPLEDLAEEIAFEIVPLVTVEYEPLTTTHNPLLSAPLTTGR
jgi:hypothetical protein